MRDEIEEAIKKLSELSIKNRDFAIDFITEAHRQETRKSKERAARRVSASDGREKFHTSTGALYKDRSGEVLHRGDRVKINTPGSAQGIKIRKGDLGYITGVEKSSGYAIVTVDKLIGKSKETIKRLPRNITILK